MVMMHTVITVYIMWHVIVTIDVAVSDGIWVVVLGDVAMGNGIQGVVLGDVAMGMGPGWSSLGCGGLWGQ